MSSSPSDENGAIYSVNNIRAFIRLLTNLDVTDLSYMKLPTFHTIFQSCDMLRVLKLNGLRRGLFFDGSGGSLLWVEYVIRFTMMKPS
jgi:hypothetical protein